MTNEEFTIYLAKEYYKSVYQYVNKICSDESLVADVVQETMLIAYQKADELKKHPNVKGWLYRTARYRMLRILENTLNYEDLESFADLLSDNSNLEEEYIASLEKYPRMARELEPDELRLIVKHFEEGYSLKELAQEYNTAVSPVKMRILRIKRKLQKRLKKSDSDYSRS